MATIKAGILNSQKTPEPIAPDLRIYGVDGLPTKSEHMPNLNVVRTDDAVGMTPADFHNVFPFNEIVNENVPTFVEYGQWDANYNTFEDQSQMVYELSKADNVFYEHLFGTKPSTEMYGMASRCKIYVKDPNNRYNYVVASGTKYGNTINFENCVYHMDNMNAYLQEIMEGMDTSYTYPVVRYGTFFIMAHMTAVTGYIYHNGTNWIRMSETAHYLQPLDETIPKQEITTSSVFKTLDDNKYWRYNGGTSYTIADFDEIPIPLTPTKRIPKFYVKRGMNADGTWYEKISKTKHDETWLCHKAFISDDEIEKPYIYVASEIVTSTYRDLREDRGNFKVYGETEYDMLETLFRIAYASWMSTYGEEDENGIKWIIADLREFGIEYLDCVLRVETSYDEIIGETDIDGVGFGSPFATHNGMAMRVSDISTFRNVKGQSVDGLRVPEDAPADGAMYHFNEIEINGNDIFKYVDIVSEHDDPNPVIRQSINPDVGPEGGFVAYQRLSNDTDLGTLLGIEDSESVLFDIPLMLAAPNQDMGIATVDLYVGTNGQLEALYDACANETITPNDVYYVNDAATTYFGDISGESGFPIPIYNFGIFDASDNASFIVTDLTPLEMGLGLVLAKVAGVSIPNNNIVITDMLSFTLRDIEVAMRNGTFWQWVYGLLQEPAFLEKQDKFNPDLMELYTYTKTNNRNWEYWNYEHIPQPNDVGIGTGMNGFLEYMRLIFLFIQFSSSDATQLLRTTFLNADFFAYDPLLFPVQTRLVMLP